MADVTGTFNQIYSGLPSFSDYFTKLQANRQGINTAQKGETGDYLSRYKTAIGSQETVPHMATRIGAELGLPELQQNAFNLNQTLQQLPGTTTAATRGFDVNENQRQRMIAAQTAKLAPLAQTATAQAQNAQNTLNTQMGYLQAQQAKELTPYEKESSFLSDRLAREYSGFNSDSENELNSLLQKMQTGATLTNSELQRAQDLAISEKNYRLKKDEMASNERIANLKAAAKFWSI